MKLIKQILIIFVLAVCLLLLFENYAALSTPFSFRFSLYFKSLRWATSPLPMWLIIVIAFALGYLVSFLPGFMQRHSYRKRIKVLENELKNASIRPAPADSTSVTGQTGSSAAQDTKTKKM